MFPQGSKWKRQMKLGRRNEHCHNADERWSSSIISKLFFIAHVPVLSHTVHKLYKANYANGECNNIGVSTLTDVI